MSRAPGRTFRSLHIRNYRIYFFGQLVSQAGTFMQAVAQSWLVLKITGSGTALGVVVMLQFLPLLFLGGPAGVIIDRSDRRKLYILTQCLAGVEALLLGILTISGVIQLWMVFVMAFTLGLITVIDQPTKQTFIYDMVGPEDITNAVSLSMAMGSTSRAVGPAMAGIAIAAIGIGPCFLLNAASFVAVLASLTLMRSDELHRSPPQPRAKRQFRDGVSYVGKERELLAVLILSAVVFGIAWEFDVVLPLLAKFEFHGGAGLFGLMTSAVAVGSMLGTLATASAQTTSSKLLVVMGLLAGGTFMLAAVMPVLPLEFVALVLVGASVMGLGACCSSRLQTGARPDMRGRVMGLFAVACVGTRPVGGPLVGWVGQQFGARASLGVGGASVLLGVLCWAALTRGGEGFSPAIQPEVAVLGEVAAG